MFFSKTVGSLLVVSSSAFFALAQGSTNCDPLNQTCPADPAFSSMVNTYDFTTGPSDEFVKELSQGLVTYGPEGMTFTIQKDGDSPRMNSKDYFMFGRVDITLQAAAGTGIVSSMVLQSDDLDEIDWEFIGGVNNQAQTNYFSKGYVGTYNRGGVTAVSGVTTGFHTYSFDWTEEQITWLVDNQPVRVLTKASVGDAYPQSPCQLKIGSWVGGSPSNANGTIEWAGGLTDFSKAPFIMYVKEIVITVSATGQSYVYTNKSGDSSSIELIGQDVPSNTTTTSSSSSTTSATSTTSVYHNSSSIVTTTEATESSHDVSNTTVASSSSTFTATTGFFNTTTTSGTQTTQAQTSSVHSGAIKSTASGNAMIALFFCVAGAVLML